MNALGGLKNTEGRPLRNPLSFRNHKNNHEDMKEIKVFTEEGIMNSDCSERMREKGSQRK